MVSTQYSVLSTQYPMLRNQKSKLSTQYCSTGTRTRCSALRRRRSPCRRQRHGAAGPRFAGNGLRQGAGKVLCLCGRDGDNTPHPNPLPEGEGDWSPSTAARGGGWPSAILWPAPIAASNTSRPNRGCSASTARWGPARIARALAISSASTWTWSCPIRARRSAKGPSRPGTRRPTPTNWRNCWPWPRTTICRLTCRSPS